MKKINLTLLMLTSSNVFTIEYPWTIVKEKKYSYEGMNIKETHYHDGDLLILIKEGQKRGEVCGLLKKKLGTANLYNLRVDGKYRSNGIGTNLFNKMCCVLKSHGCVQLSWSVLPETPHDLSRLIKFYEKKGACIVSDIGPYMKLEL